MATFHTRPGEVYILDFDANECGALVLDDIDDADRVGVFDGTGKAASWQSPKMRWDTADRKVPVPDFSTISGGGLVFSDRALEALGDLLEGRGELLPLAVADGADWQVFNITRLVDALDEGRSAIERFDDGRVLGIDHYALYPDRLAGESIFKLPQKPAVYEYVTDEFRRRVEQAQLTGFLWGRRVWTVDARSGAA